MGTIAQLFASGERRAHKGLFNNLVMLARVDGEVAESEKNLLKRIASRLSLTDAQVKEIMDNPDSYPMVPPVTKEERLDRFVQFVEMVCVDGVVDPAEEKLAAKYAVALGFDSEDAMEIGDKVVELFKQGKTHNQILEEIL